jgi:hypothetical protein
VGDGGIVGLGVVYDLCGVRMGGYSNAMVYDLDACAELDATMGMMLMQR